MLIFRKISCIYERTKIEERVGIGDGILVLICIVRHKKLFASLIHNLLRYDYDYELILFSLWTVFFMIYLVYGHLKSIT